MEVMQELKGKRVLVLGLGRSGRSAAAFCARCGARVLAADEAELDPAPLRAELGPEVALRLALPFPDPADFDLVVPSPGVSAPRWRARARRALGDVELAARALPIPCVAVTGTNGKSTAVHLIAAMLREAGLRARAAGNVGEPALGLVGQPLDAAVLEVSSFQLEASEAFRPRVAVLLNLSDDHLDRHGSFEAYAAAKARIFAAQGPGDVAIANGDDRRVLALVAELPVSPWLFRRSGPVPRGAWGEAGAVAWSSERGIRRSSLDGLCTASARPPLASILAGLLAVRGLGADPARALRALGSFRTLPHRLELVRSLGGVRFVDDSKATNPGAARFALERQQGPVLWIAGGRDKALDFRSLADCAASRVRRALLIGEAAPKLARALAGRVAAEELPSLEAAVGRAHALAEPGDVVLLAPACASFDQFASFEERGERFRAAVSALPGEAAP